jgi:uncharacterized protein (DUF2249 family)
MMAGRITIAEAAKIGCCTVEDLKTALVPLGFVWVTREEGTNGSGGKPIPAWFAALTQAQVQTLDVRPTISGGKDPLKEIMQQYKALPEGKVLCIINSFIPYPLIDLLQAKGAASFTETISGEEHRTWFLKEKNKAGEEKRHSPVVHCNEAEFTNACNRFEPGRLQTIDVRPYEMPIPMQMILEALGRLPAGNGLLVYHKRIPVYLLEELADRKYNVLIYTAADTDIRLLIHQT